MVDAGRPVRRWGLVGLGLVVALALPIAYWVIGLGLEGNVFSESQVRPVADLLAATVLAGLLLGPAGLVLAARSAGVTGTGAWVVILGVGLIVLAGLSALGFLTMYGALGSGL
jgi:hypothetical protein